MWVFLASAGARIAPRAHVIVDSSPADPIAVAGLRVGMIATVIAVVTLVAVGIQIWLAKRTLDATMRELKLAEEQLQETKTAAEQTTTALTLTQQQIELMRADSISAVRRSAPQVVAEVRDETFENIPERTLYVINKGNGVARYVTTSGLTPAHEGSTKVQSAAEHVFQVLGPGEERSAMNLSYPTGSYARNVRIRYYDALGNKYITEYQTINEGLAYPVLREPWLGREFGFPRPAKWSDEVSWPVEHYERQPGLKDELVEVTPDEEQQSSERPSIFESLGIVRSEDPPSF